MIKCYVFPVRKGTAYLGVKAHQNPYGNGEWWCADCPSPFGGNDDDEDVFVTLSKEAGQESHGKLDLEAAKFTYIDKYVVPQQESPMKFYYAQGFDYNRFAVLPHGFAIQPAYQETTGEVLLLKLNQAPIGYNTASWVLEQMQQQLTARQISNLAQAQFLASETVKAFQDLVRLHLNHAIV